MKINTALSLTEVDDVLLQNIAAAWPKLRVLHIAFSEHMKLGFSKVTLNGLAFLAVCRDLVELSVPFNSNLCVDAFKGVPQNSLSHVILAMSSLTVPKEVVHVLSTVFTNLSKIGCYEDSWRGDKLEVRLLNWQITVDLFLELYPGVDTELVIASGDSGSE